MSPNDFTLDELTVIACAVAHHRDKGLAHKICQETLRKIEEACSVSGYDWTSKDGRTNSSDEFIELGEFVGQIIRDSAFDIVSGRTDKVGHLIMAQLAHIKNLGPRKPR